VLEQHLDAGGTALREALREGAGHDDVVAQILAVKEARVTLEAAVGVDAFEVERQELHLVPRRCRARCVREHASQLRFVRIAGVLSGCRLSLPERRQIESPPHRFQELDAALRTTDVDIGRTGIPELVDLLGAISSAQDIIEECPKR
jgi:hypothetical protein